MSPRRTSPLPAAVAILVLLSCGCGKPPAAAPAATVSEAAAVPTPIPTPASPVAEAATYVLTDDTEIEWTGYKIVGSHSGSFLMYQGSVELPNGTLDAARFNVTIDTMSVMTDNDTLTGVMKGENFFDVNTYPESTFVSTAVERDGDGFHITGDLTLRDVTRSIRFPAAMSVDNDRFTLAAEFTVNRRDWGIAYDGIGDNLLKDDVRITLSVEAERAAGEG